MSPWSCRRLMLSWSVSCFLRLLRRYFEVRADSCAEPVIGNWSCPLRKINNSVRDLAIKGASARRMTGWRHLDHFHGVFCEVLMFFGPIKIDFKRGHFEGFYDKRPCSTLPIFSVTALKPFSKWTCLTQRPRYSLTSFITNCHDFSDSYFSMRGRGKCLAAR